MYISIQIRLRRECYKAKVGMRERNMLSYEGYLVWIENEKVSRWMNNHCDVIRGMEECFGLSDLITVYYGWNWSSQWKVNLIVHELVWENMRKDVWSHPVDELVPKKRGRTLAFGLPIHLFGLITIWLVPWCVHIFRSWSFIHACLCLVLLS